MDSINIVINENLFRKYATQMMDLEVRKYSIDSEMYSHSLNFDVYFDLNAYTNNGNMHADVEAQDWNTFGKNKI